MFKSIYSRRSNLVSTNIVDSVFQKAGKFNDVIFLAGGTPPFPLPSYVWDEISSEAKINIKLSQYSHDVKGDINLRKLIAEELSKEFKYNVSEEEILITVGSSAAMFAIFQTFINPDDEVLWTTPGYPGNMAQIKLTGGKLIEVPLIEKDKWKMDITRIEKEATRKTKMFVYADPLNPTGTVFTDKEKHDLLSIAESKNFIILADETYRHIIYPETNFKSIMINPDAKSRVIMIRSFSKDFSMSGFRLGFVYANKEIIEKIESIHIAMNICASCFSQELAKNLFVNKEILWSNFVNEYDRRRKIMIDDLDKLKGLFTYVKPMGGFFIFLKYTIPINSLAFFDLLLKSAKVAVMPGIAFGSGGENHVRVSFTNTPENITEALHRISESLNNV